MLRIRHTGIYVNNMDLMKRFYCNVLGMNVVSEGDEGGFYIETLLGIPGLTVNVCKLSFPDGTMIELVKADRGSEPYMYADNVVQSGCIHIALTVEDVWSLYSKLIKKGIRFISDPLLSPDGKVNVCFCRDPEGNYLELVQELKK